MGQEYEAACLGKQSFQDRNLAARAAGRRKNRRIYRCQFCHQWHVGTDTIDVGWHRKPKRPPPVRLFLEEAYD